MNKKEVNPILPINIKAIMMHLPIVDSSGVIPKDNPVVPKAEHTSNIISTSSACLSVMLKMTTEKKHIPIASRVIASDFKTSSS